MDIQIRVRKQGFEDAKAKLTKIYAVNEGGFTGPDAISFEDYSRQPALGVHLTVAGSACDVQVAFRDILRKSDALRQEYDELKRSYQGESMEAYRDAKADFVARVLESPNKCD